MNRIRIIVSIIAVLLSSHSLSAQNNLNKEWLNEDIQIFTEFLPILKSGEFDLISLMKIRGIKVSDENGDLGLGYNKRTYYQNGGYTSISIKTLLDPNDLIVKYRIRISANKNALNVLNEKMNINSLLSHYKDERYGDYITLELIKTNSELYSKMIICFDEYFGIKRVSIPSALADDYLLLTDPFNEDIYGFYVGISGRVPDFRLATNRIKKVKNKEILELVMASPNPVGRIYAIEAISNGNLNNIRNNKKYSNILNQIFKLKIPIAAGAGCTITSMTFDSYEELNEVMRDIKF